MSVHSPGTNWFKPPSGNEKIWIGLAITWCVVMSLMMPYWHLKGKQNSTGEAYAVTPEQYLERVKKFIAPEEFEEGFQVEVAPAPGTHAYMYAKQYYWFPTLRLRAGETYFLHLSSLDFQHGFSVQPVNMNFQVLPGYDHVLTITPTTKGTFPIVCNEFCGIGHQNMVGKIIVD